MSSVPIEHVTDAGFQGVPPHGEHLVQFYENDEFLASAVAAFLGEGIAAGEPAIMIATREHRDAVLALLREQGIDVERERRDGRFVALDARETLATFMDGDLPERSRFEATIGPAIEGLLRASGRSVVRAYGEMVDVLWKEGNSSGALQLEGLWNDLAAKYSFALLCAYAISSFYKESHAEGLRDVCRAHRHVFPAPATGTHPTLQATLLDEQARALQAEIRHRKQVERALRDALARSRQSAEDGIRLAAIVHSSDDAIVSKDLDGTVVSWNRAAEQIFGYSADEMVGQSIRRIIPPERQTEEDEVLARIRRGESVDHFETVRRHKDGSEVHISLTVSPVKDAAGRVIGASKIARDITQRRQLERERARALESEKLAREDAERTNRVKDEFLAMLSHELRTPLSAILGWTRIAATHEAKKPDRDSTLGRSLEVIQRNALAQVRIIDDLLDVSRIVSGKLQIEPRPVELRALARAVAEGIQPEAAAKGIALETRGASDAPLTVQGDSARLQQVLWNLLANAIKFTPRGGSVELLLERAGAQARVSVRDSGEGIDPAFLPHVFERFRQADTNLARRHGGLGLGLAVARYLVEAHHGSISAASPGKGLGASFSFALPLAAAGTREAEPVVERGAALDGVRVLVVDDDRDARELALFLLEQSGAAVVTAASADEALELLALRPYDIMLADLGMPVRDGYMLIEAVRRHPDEAIRALPAVAVSAFTGEGHHAKARAAGFDDYVTKPVSGESLARLTARLLTRAASAAA
jgi:PAS domain S-box-containing protein